MRPLLTPAARRLWRDRETLQLGLSPGRAVVLAGVDGVTRAVLALLDGTRDKTRLLREADAVGSTPEQTEQVLALLGQAGLLDDASSGRSAAADLERDERDRLAPDLGSLRLVGGVRGGDAVRRRLASRVIVEGAGRVGAPLAAALAAGGVGSVEVVDDGVTRPEDCGVGGLPPSAVGRSRGEAARELLPARPAASRLRLPDLVVLAPAAGVPLGEPPRLVPHLVAEVRGEVGVVGPLVTPGASACLRCLDLARADRDPGWPALALQLGEAVPGVVPCDSALSLAVAAQAALQALSFLDGLLSGGARPATVGGTLELTLPDWRWRRRSWQVHPDCGCGWRATG